MSENFYTLRTLSVARSWGEREIGGDDKKVQSFCYTRWIISGDPMYSMVTMVNWLTILYCLLVICEEDHKMVNI